MDKGRPRLEDSLRSRLTLALPRVGLDRASRRWSLHPGRAAILILFLVSYPAALATSDTGATSLEETMLEAVRERSAEWFHPNQGIPGAAVAVVSSKQLMWQKTYGNTREGGQAITTTTLFAVQSISKDLTALAVLRATESGLVELDRPISDYLPDFRLQSRWEATPEKTITLRHLLSHRAGLTHQAPVGSYFDQNPHTFEDHIDSISHTWLRYPVGRQLAYSNLGFDLAAYIVQRVSGVPFAVYVQEQVLDPLGMTHATFDFDRVKESLDCARGHYEGDRPIMNQHFRSPMLGAGGLWASLQDMTHLAQFHLTGRSLSAAFLPDHLVLEQQRIQFAEPGQRNGSGLGIFRRDAWVDGVFSLAHTGSGYGYQAVLHTYPQLRLAVVMIYNSLDPKPREELISLLDELVSQTIGTAPKQSYSDLTRGMTPVTPSDSRIQSVLGRYHPFLTLRIEDETLIADTGSWSEPLEVFEDATGQLHGLIGGGGHYLRIRTPSSTDPGGIIWSVHDGTVMDLQVNRVSPGPVRPELETPPPRSLAGSYHAFAGSIENPVSFELGFDQDDLVVDGWLCALFESGRCMTPDGEVLDFRGDRPVFKNIRLLPSRP